MSNRFALVAVLLAVALAVTQANADADTDLGGDLGELTKALGSMSNSKEGGDGAEMAALLGALMGADKDVQEANADSDEATEAVANTADEDKDAAGADVQEEKQAEGAATETTDIKVAASNNVHVLRARNIVRSLLRYSTGTRSSTYKADVRASKNLVATLKKAVVQSRKALRRAQRAYNRVYVQYTSVKQTVRTAVRPHTGRIAAIKREIALIDKLLATTGKFGSRHSGEMAKVRAILHALRRKLAAELGRRQAIVRVQQRQLKAARKTKQLSWNALKAARRDHSDARAALRHAQRVLRATVNRPREPKRGLGSYERKMLKKVLRLLAKANTLHRRVTSGCSPLRGISGGRIKCSGRRTGDSCRFSCSNGYAIRGSRTRVCKSNGRWSGSQPRCSMNVRCRTDRRSSNHAGVIRVHPRRGYTMIGGGMNNRYRGWNRLSIFEETMPEGGHWRCDMGNGPGKLDCYLRSCRMPRNVKCINRSRRKRGSGIIEATCPRGYTMMGGGMYNHYRHHNRRSVFEEFYPRGNGYRCDMGLGWGDFTCHARCCRLPKNKARCRTLSKRNRRAGVTRVTCPRGYVATGGGVLNHRRRNDVLSIFEEAFPEGSRTWRCDTGAGAGDLSCFVRCCQFD